MKANNILSQVGLNIDQVSQLTGVKKSTLRYWEKEFNQYLQPDRTPTNRRLYNMDDVEKVENLRHLIEEEKYKSIGVKMKLGLNDKT